MEYKKLILLAVLGCVFVWVLNSNLTRTGENIQVPPNGISVSSTPSKLCCNVERDSSKGNTLYSVWVRSFRDSDGDGYGDLVGITNQLQYISDLGVKKLLLSPIFPSPAYHGYEVTDYLSIDPIYGTKGNFLKLIRTADELGIKILLDLPVNHTSDQHQWFKNSLSNVGNFRDFYKWVPGPLEGYGLPWSNDSDPYKVFHSKVETEEFYYGVFGYASPDLNYSNPEVVDKIKEVVKFWIEEGVDGFRLDAARYFVETGPLQGQRDTEANRNFLLELTGYAKELNPEVEFLAEAYAEHETANSYQKALTGVDYQFDFEVGPFVHNVVTSEELSVSEKVNSLRNTLSFLLSNTTNASEKYVFFENHDFPRANFHSTSLAKIAHSIVLALPYNFSLYYGGELGLPGFSTSNDLYFRDDMIWDDGSQTNWNTQYIEDTSTYLKWKKQAYADVDSEFVGSLKKLILIRNKLADFYKGNVHTDFELSTNNHFIVTTASKGSVVFTIVNMDDQFSSIFNVNALPAQRYYSVLTNQPIEQSAQITLAPGESLTLVSKQI
ncbi:alpha-amylase family glycosyl hydrolase [Alteromonas sp. H39]|uniref:alpha-amylase family glycosyl hydrolase n=1 Tax=Alteromonas sp. H39 TaxID=3389876 RepID=UPI0039E095BB